MALTMPAVTVFSRPNGEPIAATHSPTFSFDGSPSLTVGSPVASIFTTATSVRVSAPITFALNSRLSVILTVSSEASATTCAFVRMYPSGVMMNPEPCPWRGIGCASGIGIWNRRKNSYIGSPGLNGISRVAPAPAARCVTLILTTAGPWLSTRPVKSGRERPACAATGAAVAAAAGAAWSLPIG